MRYEDGMKIVILGAGGQLGRALIRILPPDTIALGRADCDVAEPTALREKLLALTPTVVINASAYTLVDRAESEPGLAFAVNALAVRELALVCRDLDAVLVHISTDYVFGLERLRDSPYDEDDPPGPVNVYGASKLAGELLLRAIWPKHFILRTCGVYGSRAETARGNFVDTMLRLATTCNPVRVVADQQCTPTSAEDLAGAVRELLGSEAYGLYQVTSAGACSWHEFADAIFELSGLAPNLQAITSAEYVTAAKRPRYSVLSNRRWISAGFTPLRPWREALQSYLAMRLRT